jgi:hypothetical protein
VLGLMFAFLGACTIASEMLSWNSGVDSREFWIVNAALLTAYLSYFAICFLATAAVLSFVGSNRSTALRIAMVVQQALFLGWMGIGWLVEGFEQEFLTVAAVISGLHWFAMGAFMTGEPRLLSPRVKRDLPRSFLGRAFLTWYNPGPATGYMLAVSSYFGVIVMLCAALLAPHHLASDQIEHILVVFALGLSYVAVYLGVGRWLLGILGKYGPIAPATRVLVYSILLSAGTIAPLTVQMTIPGMRYDGYTVLQATNPFWTMTEAVDNTPAYEISIAAIFLGVAAVVVFVLSLPAVAEEIRQVRIAAPSRVAEEDAEIAALTTPHVHVKTNPWDE